MRGLREAEEPERWRITADDLHDHLRARMAQGGIRVDEIERTLNDGWPASDARPGTLGKTIVLAYERE